MINTIKASSVPDPAEALPMGGLLAKVLIPLAAYVLAQRFIAHDPVREHVGDAEARHPRADDAVEHPVRKACDKADRSRIAAITPHPAGGDSVSHRRQP